MNMDVASQSSSVYSSRRGSQIDLKGALKELDLYYWKTHQDFLHEFNRRHAPGPITSPSEPSAKKRGRSRRPSFKRAVSQTTDSSNQLNAPQPGNVLTSPTSPTISFRSKSWGPPRRLAAKSQREPSPVPSFHGPSEYLHDADTRARLKMYFSDPNKFDEALQLGFPSAMPMSEVKESPVIPAPRPSTRGRNLGLDVQRFMRGDVVSWINSSEGQHSPQGQPENDSEREVENFARELAVQNAVPAAPDNHYDREFDIGDYENAIDDSQDDRGTPSPISPITPPADEVIPLPLAPKHTVSRRTFSDSRPQVNPSMKSERSKSFHQKSASRSSEMTKPLSEANLRAAMNNMVRTAPPLCMDPMPLPYSSVSQVCPISHGSKGSMSSMEMSSMSSECFFNKVQHHHSTYHKHQRRHSSQQEPVTPSSHIPRAAAHPTFENAAPTAVRRTKTPHHKSQQNLRASMAKDLPPLPLEWPPTSKKQPLHNYNYDSPSAYVSPRSPPAPPAEIPRQMTLRMTLTRPELRATEEEIYGRARSHTDPPAQLYHHTKPSKPPHMLPADEAQAAEEARARRREQREHKHAQLKELEAKMDGPVSMKHASTPIMSPKGEKAKEKDKEKGNSQKENNKLRKTRADTLFIEPRPQQSLAQLGLDGEWHTMTMPESAPAGQREFRVAFAQGGPVNYGAEKENRRSLWKKMSFGGKRSSGPGVVLP